MIILSSELYDHRVPSIDGVYYVVNETPCKLDFLYFQQYWHPSTAYL